MDFVHYYMIFHYYIITNQVIYDLLVINYHYDIVKKQKSIYLKI